MFVLVSTGKNFMQSAYMVGTRKECQIYQMANGLRACSEIQPW